ncbi:MAG: tRNA (adenosine(37)-N6)-threonylcarbamoyltransferase complex dimerization subunit type 1 TsaB [Solidesulfovibrio sp. DCME]|uniref:tRNA (adenosine(37)-N6)-threonylcarbamoyltransferase complex dimerization subunit type 1 TsaB n=1 Tax=Solidesulfovibrio sp. DCME TaxID=3447380 RepID=UPI003D120025
MASPAGPGPLLVLNGVSPELTVLLGRPGWAPLVRTNPATGQAAALLAPLIGELLGQAGLAPADLAGVACVRGPGSFTGIRVVLATALGLSLGAGLPMAGLDFLPLLAASAARAATGAILAVTHARAGQVYVQSFLADGELAAMGPPEALFLDAALARAAEGAAVGPLWLVGDGAVRHREAFLRLVPLATVLGPEACAPDPGTLLAAAAAADYSMEPVSPLYLRPSDAEENLAALAAGRGLSPEAAATMLRRAVTRD